MRYTGLWQVRHTCELRQLLDAFVFCRMCMSWQQKQHRYVSALYDLWLAKLLLLEDDAKLTDLTKAVCAMV